MFKDFKCVTGTPQGKDQSSPRIWSCFSLFSHLISPIQFSILFLTLQSARQITGLLYEPLVSFWFLNSHPRENTSGVNLVQKTISDILGTQLKPRPLYNAMVLALPFNSLPECAYFLPVLLLFFLQNSFYSSASTACLLS